MAIKSSQSALSLAQSTGNNEKQSGVFINFAFIKWSVGDYTTGQVYAKEACRLARVTGHLSREAYALRAEALNWLRLGDYVQGILLADRAKSLLDMCGLPHSAEANALRTLLGEVQNLKSEYVEAHTFPPSYSLLHSGRELIALFNLCYNNGGQSSMVTIAGVPFTLMSEAKPKRSRHAHMRTSSTYHKPHALSCEHSAAVHDGAKEAKKIANRNTGSSNNHESGGLDDAPAKAAHKNVVLVELHGMLHLKMEAEGGNDLLWVHFGWDQLETSTRGGEQAGGEDSRVSRGLKQWLSRNRGRVIAPWRKEARGIGEIPVVKNLPQTPVNQPAQAAVNDPFNHGILLINMANVEVSMGTAKHEIERKIKVAQTIFKGIGMVTLSLGFWATACAWQRVLGPLRGIAASRLDLCLLVFNFAVFTESHSIPISVLSKPTFGIVAVSENHTKFGAQKLHDSHEALVQADHAIRPVGTQATHNMTSKQKNKHINSRQRGLNSAVIHAKLPQQSACVIEIEEKQCHWPENIIKQEIRACSNVWQSCQSVQSNSDLGAAPADGFVEFEVMECPVPEYTQNQREPSHIVCHYRHQGFGSRRLTWPDGPDQWDTPRALQLLWFGSNDLREDLLKCGRAPPTTKAVDDWRVFFFLTANLIFSAESRSRIYQDVSEVEVVQFECYVDASIYPGSTRHDLNGHSPIDVPP
ncbi:hypothetical protein C8F04DRAFT_1301551 [Mycena alexandri]|uniref:Uncharacterized protein n=1 Tax=Mycena alexandri TaxID=1745969 RepID=A0AAD6WTH8_9AGAR|nr:hypothetical protein C8F04DRAFT_1301551 [Mycena alexandri]